MSLVKNTFTLACNRGVIVCHFLFNLESMNLFWAGYDNLGYFLYNLDCLQR